METFAARLAAFVRILNKLAEKAVPVLSFQELAVGKYRLGIAGEFQKLTYCMHRGLIPTSF